MHYPYKNDSKYTDIKEISAVNEERIRLARSESETYTDEKFNQEQSTSIQNEINRDKHGIYLEPFYQQVTLTLAKSKEKTQRLSEDYHLQHKKKDYFIQKNFIYIYIYKIQIKGKSMNF